MEKNDIIIIHGTDYKNMAKRVLEQAGVAADIGDVNKKIALKPNLVTAKAPSSGATTHSELLAGVIEYLREHGFQNITIMEGSWVGDHTEPSGLQPVQRPLRGPAARYMEGIRCSRHENQAVR